MSNKKTIWSTVVSILSSVVAFLGIVSCCGMPLLAGILAALGIGASQLAFFAEYRGWFISLAIVSLLFGFYQSYFRTCNCCGNDSKEGNRKKARSIAIQRIFLWTGAIVVITLLFAGNRKQTNASTSCCPAGQEEVTTPTCCPAETDETISPNGGCCGE